MLLGLANAAGRLLVGSKPNQKKPGRQGGLIRLPGKVLTGNLAFNAGQWDAFFSRWMPSVTRGVSVKVVGAKSTMLSGVIQFAIATAMSVLRQTDKIAPINFGLGLKVDHVNNMVNVVITTQSLAMYEGLLAMKELLKHMDDKGFWEVGEIDVAALSEQLGKKLGTEAPSWLTAIGVDVEALGNLPGKLSVIAHRLAEILSKSVGGNGFWNIGMNKDYKGGNVFPGLRPADKGHAKLFDALVGDVLFTRHPAKNPHPPSYDGKDLRTLLAQALHDPGVVSPIPKTDQGQPTIDRE